MSALQYAHLEFRRRRGAFTLVELLVVIGIIALLISILLPSLNRARESARTVECAANLRQVGQAMALFTNDHDGRFPSRARRLPANHGAGEGYTPGPLDSWHDILNHKVFGTRVRHRGSGGPIQTFYAGSSMPDEEGGHEVGPAPRRLVCPNILRTNLGMWRVPWTLNDKAAGGANWIGWSEPPAPNVPGEPGLAGAFVMDDSFFDRWLYLGARVTMFRNPAEKWLVLEAARAHFEADIRSNTQFASVSEERPWTETNGMLAFRHPGLRMNVLFVDGHVDSVGISELRSMTTGEVNAKHMSFNGEGHGSLP